MVKKKVTNYIYFLFCSLVDYSLLMIVVSPRILLRQKSNFQNNKKRSCMEFIHEYLWYLNQCFDSSALRASQSFFSKIFGDLSPKNNLETTIIHRRSSQDSTMTDIMD